MSRVPRTNPARPHGQKQPRRRPARLSAMLWALCLFALLSLMTLGVSAQYTGKSEEALSGVSSQPSNKQDPAAAAEFVPGDILVRYRTNEKARLEEIAATPLTKNGRAISLNVKRFEGSDLVPGLRLARVSPADTLDAVAALKQQPDVVYAEPNYIWRKKATNDAHYDDLWAMKNTGQQGSNDYVNQIQPGTPGEDIDAELAWNITTGSKSVVVAVIDEGIDINHADLKDNIWVNPGESGGGKESNGIDDDGDGFIDDVNGWDFVHNDKSVYDGGPDDPATANINEARIDDHGTHVAGTIGARGNNGVGVVGVNWQVSIMSVKVLGPTGGSISNIIKGYNYVRMMSQRGINVRVTNNSYGGPGFSQAAFDAISQLNQAGVLVVVAAGNDSQDTFSFPDYPSGYDLPNVLGVAATDRFGQIALFSNFGARLVSMGAPGRGILSTTPHNYPTPQYTDPDGSTYTFFSGTSMATPHVAGAAALALSANPNLSVQNLRGVLAYSGEVSASLQGKTTTGRRLNLYQTILSAQENDVTAPAAAAALQLTGQTGRSVTLQWSAPGDDGNVGTASDYDFFFVYPNGTRLLLPTTLLPAAAGTTQSATINLPLLNFSGTVELRAYDNAGNFSTASLPVSIPQNAESNPYVVTESAPEALSATGSGTPLQIYGDDEFKENVALPFAFPFYGQSKTSVNVSTNGALYFSRIPRDDNGDGLDAGSSVQGLQGQSMIAGLWDDLMTNQTGNDIFMVQPAPNRVIFRWEGVTFDTPLSTGTRGMQPVNFEIELRSDGTIIYRYGAGQSSPTNTRLFPIVGISSGEPDAYVVTSHTSDNTLFNLTNAQTVTFTPRASVPVCSYALSLTTQNFTASAASSSVNVTAGSGCNWTAVSNNPFITVTSGASGTGNGTVGFSVAANTASTSRQGTVTIAGQTFTVTQDGAVQPASVQLGQSSYTVSEGQGFATVTVTRTGDTSSAMTVRYSTSDTTDANFRCDPNTAGQPTGVASRKCDYHIAAGKLRFAPGETSKQIILSIVDDVYVEGPETFTLNLNNLTITVLGISVDVPLSISVPVTIADNDAPGQPNPIDNTHFYVRQLYVDLLSREPDPAGWNGWTTRIDQCGQPGQPPPPCDRVTVGGDGFLRSGEFFDRQFFVLRLYRTAFGRILRYDEVGDLAYVSGFLTTSDLELNKQDLVADIMARTEFTSRYNSLTNAQFVDTLLQTAAVTVAQTTRDTWVAQLNAGRSRAQVYREISEQPEVSARYGHEAQVVSAYYGFFTRNPDGAYLTFLDRLDRGEINLADLANAFINAQEYRQRFGP